MHSQEIANCIYFGGVLRIEEISCVIYYDHFVFLPYLFISCCISYFSEQNYDLFVHSDAIGVE